MAPNLPYFAVAVAMMLQVPFVSAGTIAFSPAPFPHFYPNINGFAYLMSVVQHPSGESDMDKLADPTEAFGYAGHLVFPAMDRWSPSLVENSL